MLQLCNNTPFASQLSVTTNPQGAEVIVLAVKATFTLVPIVAVAKEQVPLILADQHWGDPGVSSLRYAAECLLPKPGVEVILNGHAYSPNGQKADVMDVRLAVGNESKTIRVFGDRLWLNGGLSAPVPFEMMPLLYENAFGGIHHFKPDQPLSADSAVAVAANPLGKGFIGKRLARDMIGQALPNLEDPRYLIRTPQDQPKPVGFGYIAPTWEPRKNYAGTYDESWSKARAPFLPVDFDPRFLLTGSTGLSFERNSLVGGEPIRLSNLAPQADIQFELPVCPLTTSFKLEGAWHRSPAALETILIEPDQNRFCMIWKALFACPKKVLRVSDILVDFVGSPVVNGSPTAAGAN